MNTQVYRRPFKVVSLKEKLAILQKIESGSSRREIEEIFKCSQSTICRILVSKDSILQETKNCDGDKLENLTANNYAYKELYKALTKWAKEMKRSNDVITAHVARKKAEELSRNMGQELSPSNAWLYRWKERENVQFAKKSKVEEQVIKEPVKIQGEQMQSENVNKETSSRLKLNDEYTRLPISKNEQEDILQDQLPTKNIPKSDVVNTDSSKKPKSNNKVTYLPGNNQESISHNRLSTKNIRKSFNEHRPKRGYIQRSPTSLVCRNRKEKTFLTLLQKLELLQRLRNGERRPDLIKEYNLSQSALSQIVNEEEKILKVAAEGQNLQMKRIRGGIFRDGEAELNNWVLQEMTKGVCLTKTQIKNRAKEIAERLNIDFKASTGWLEKWKVRMNMEFNENQILHRKVPQYLANDTGSNGDIEPEDTSDVVYDYFESQEIKQEIEDFNYSDDIDYSHEELNCEVKSEFLTPQQFYLQTIENDRLAEQHSKKDQERQLKLAEDMRKEEIEPEETDIKPFIDSALRLESTTLAKEAFEDTAHSLKGSYIKEGKKTEKNMVNETAIKPQIKESLQDKIYNWLNRYHIEPTASKELLDILKPHLYLEGNIDSTC